MNTALFDNERYSSLYMYIAAFSIAVSGFFAKLCLVNSVPLKITVISRFSGPFIIILIFLFFTKNLPSISFHNIKTHAIRALFLTLSQILLFLSIKKISLSESMILYSTGPIFIAIYDMYTGKKLTYINILSLIFGAVGVCLMLHVLDATLNWFVLVGLASGFCLSISQILLHTCSRKENTLHVMFFIFFFSTIFSIFLLSSNKEATTSVISITYNYHIIILLFFVGIFSLLNQFFRGKAYGLVQIPSTLSPIIYFSVLVSVILDITFFKQSIDLETMSGGILTLLGSYLTIKFRDRTCINSKIRFSIPRVSK